MYSTLYTFYVSIIIFNEYLILNKKALYKHRDLNLYSSLQIIIKRIYRFYYDLAIVILNFQNFILLLFINLIYFLLFNF
jgi:hypothetical protein